MCTFRLLEVEALLCRSQGGRDDLDVFWWGYRSHNKGVHIPKSLAIWPYDGEGASAKTVVGAKEVTFVLFEAWPCGFFQV